MNNSVQQVAQEAAQEAREINVKVVGHELVSQKLFNVIMHLLLQNEVHTYDDCVRVIQFTENEPEGKFGGFRPEDKNIIINMQAHFDYACEALDDERLAKLGLRSHIWFGLLTTSIHEILHAIAYVIDPETVLNTDRQTLEDNLNEETQVHLRNLIRDYDVEPPLFEDDPFFGARYLEFYNKKIKDNAEQWAIHQKAVHDNNCIWTDEDVVCDSFREWYRVGYKHHEDPEWNKEVAPLLSADVVDETIGMTDQGMHDETTIAVGAEVEDLVVAQQIINTPAPVKTTVVDTYVPPTEGTVAAPTPEPLDIDPESLAALYNAEEPMDLPTSVDDYETTGMMFGANVAPYSELVEDPSRGPAAAPASAPKTEVAQPVESTQVNNVVDIPHVQTQLPLNTAPSTETRCRSCQKELVAEAKFCSFCGTGVAETPMPTMAPVAPTHTPNPTYPQASLNTQLPNHNLTAEQIRACVGDIFYRCWHHIYSKCGFSPGQNPQFAPHLRNAIAEPLSVIGIPCVDKILVAMDCTDQFGQYSKHAPVVNGMIRGKITKNLGLPSYTLYLNFNGVEVKRLIIPQNQWKTYDNGGYKPTAIRAQQGAMIIWLMDGDDSVPGQKWKAKIENGTLEWLV